METLELKSAFTDDQSIQMETLNNDVQDATSINDEEKKIKALSFSSSLILLAEKDVRVIESTLNSENLFSQTSATRLYREKGLQLLRKTIKISKSLQSDVPLIELYNWLPEAFRKATLLWDLWYAPPLESTQKAIKHNSIQLIRTMGSLSDENQKLRKESSNLKEEMQLLRKQLESLKQQNIDIKVQNSNLVIRNKKLDERNSKLEIQNENLLQQNNMLKQQNAHLEKLINLLSSSSNDLKIQNIGGAVKAIKIRPTEQPLSEYKKSTQSTTGHTTLFAPLPAESQTIVSKSITTQSTAVNIKYETIDVEVSQSNTTTKDTTSKAP